MKQKELNNFSVCLCTCLRYPACKSPLFCTALYCHL